MPSKLHGPTLQLFSFLVLFLPEDLYSPGRYNEGMVKEKGNTDEATAVASLAIIIYEIVAGTFELTLGILLVIFGKQMLEVVRDLITSGIPLGSHTLLARFVEKLLPYLFEQRLYLAWILLAIGLGKIVSGIGLKYQQPWANHLLVVLVGLLLPFELISLLHHLSTLKIIYTTFNIAIFVYLIKNPFHPHYKR